MNISIFKSLSIFLIGFVFSTAQSQQTMKYTIKFISNWENNTNTPLPNSAHFSDLAVTTHSNNVKFFEIGEAASPGVELIVELGDATIFANEVNDAISAGNANQVLLGPSLLVSGNS